MNCLIIGGGGFLGAYVECELKHICDVKILEHPESGMQGKHVLKADITGLGELKQIVADFDTVVHLAAIFNVDSFIRQPEDLFKVNVRGTFNVLEACAANRIRKVVFASSICAFGTDLSRIPVCEKDPPQPGGKGSGIYGMTKFLGEDLCRSYSNMHGISTICLRLAVVKDLTGDYDKNTSAGTLWSYVDVRDAAQAFRLSCEKEGLSHEVFNITAEDTLSITSNEELIARDLHWILKKNIDPDFIKDRWRSFFSIEKARSILGYSPRYGWRQ